MRSLQSIREAVNAVALATAAAALPATPANGQMACVAVPPFANGSTGAVVPFVEIAIWGAAAASLTATTLLAAAQHPFTFVEATFTADHTTGGGTLTKTAHGLLTGDGPVDYEAVTPPTGITAGAQYWVIKTGANTIQLASSLAKALAGIPVTFSDNGSGTQQLQADATCMRLWWEPVGGELGPAGDGAVAIGPAIGYRVRVEHSPLRVAYALSATISANTVNAAIYPITERS
ncbi:MAG TPA: hypothetical protein VGG28_20660 [Kofleriaceae bacterium]|jgi:hypothetical protein